MLKSLTYMGFKRFPLTYTGVPGIEREGRPVGFEREINQLIDVIEKLLNSKINENLLVVIVGEYGWGKTELLDYFVNIVADKYDNKVEIARVPLTFNLSSQHIINIIRKRSGKPLVLIIDEADEIVRALSLRKITGNGKEIERILTELSSTIRALLEPRQYAGVLGLNPEKLKNMLIIVAVTPQVYYGILKSYVPDIFDISVGRIFKEIVLRSEIPLWLYDAIIQEKLKASSTPSRLREIERGRLDPVHPLKFEYLASLYYIIKLSENRTPTPRTLLKYTAKLLDIVIRNGELNLETYIKFLREISNENSVARKILEKVEEIETLYTDDVARKIRVLLELIPIPLTREFIVEQCRCDREIIEKLVEIGEILKVNIVRFRLNDKNILRELNKYRISQGLTPIEYIDDREISIEIDDYYTRYRDEPILNIVLHDKDIVEKLKNCDIEILEGYIPRSRILLVEKVQSDSEYSITQLIRRAYTELSNPEMIITKFTEAFYNKPKILLKFRNDTYICYTTTEGLNLRICVILFTIDNEADIGKVINTLNTIIENGFIRYERSELYYDVIHIVILCPKIELDDKYVDRILEGDWKIPGIERRVFTYVSILDSSRIEQYRKAIIGRILKQNVENIPEKYRQYIKYYEDLKARIDGFLRECEKYILKNLTLGIKRVRLSKTEAIKEIVNAWIRNEKLLDQPEVWKDSNERATISNVERLLYTYLKHKYSGTKLTLRDLEKIIRKLFPIHLWKDFREKDLVETCKLRGLLIELEDKYVPYSPNIAKSIIVKRINKLRELSSKSRRQIELNICGKSLKITLQLVDVETSLSINRISNLIAEIATLKDDEESIRKFAKVMLELDDLEEKMISEISRREGFTDKCIQLTKSVNDVYDRLVKYLEDVRDLIPKISMRILKQVNDEVESTIRLLESCENINAEELYEIIQRFGEKVSFIYSEVEKLYDLLSRVKELMSKIQNLDYKLCKDVINRLRTFDSKITKLKLIDFEKLYRGINDILVDFSAKASSVLVSINRDIESVRKIVKMLCRIGYSDLCKDVDIDYKNIENIKRNIRARLLELLKREDYVDAFLELVKISDYEFSVEDIIGKLSLDDVSRFIEHLCEVGLVKRVYKFAL